MTPRGLHRIFGSHKVSGTRLSPVIFVPEPQPAMAVASATAASNRKEETLCKSGWRSMDDARLPGGSLVKIRRKSQRAIPLL